MNADLAFGVVVLSVAAAYYAATRAIPDSLLDDVVGARGLPTAYAAALALLALIQIGRGLAPRLGRASRHAAALRRMPAKTLGMLALGAGYGALLPWLGYAVSIALLLGATAAYEGSGFNRRVAAVAVVGAAGLWGLFVWLLGIPQPAGIWPSL